jgi:hypothetical protein
MERIICKKNIFVIVQNTNLSRIPYNIMLRILQSVPTFLLTVETEYLNNILHCTLHIQSS